MRASLPLSLTLCGATAFAAGCTGLHSYADDSSGAVSTTLCGPYSGASGSGTTWDYSYDDGLGSVGIVNVKVLRVYGELVLQQEVRTTGAMRTVDETIKVSPICDDAGLWTDYIETTYEITENGEQTAGTSVVSYTAPLLLLPRQRIVGTSWVVRVTGEQRDSNTGVTTLDYPLRTTIAAEEDLTVEAGTFSTLRVETETQGAVTHTWLAEGVGIVATDTMRLTEYVPYF